MIRTTWKPLIILTILVLNFFPAMVSANDVIYSDQVAVLVYHHIDDEQEGNVTISSKLFADQLKALKRKGYHFITMDQFKRFLSKGDTIPDNAVLVTFDDGYESFYTHAYPILKRMNVPAVNFVITKDLDDPMRPKIPSLSQEEIIKMRSEYPKIDFQGHSDSLHAMIDGKPFLTNKILKDGMVETDEQFKLRVINDTNLCIRKLTALNGSKSVDAYAYPFGSYDNQTVELLLQTGVHYGFTTKNGMATKDTDPMQVPRINAGSPYVKAHSVNNLIKHRLNKDVKASR